MGADDTDGWPRLVSQRQRVISEGNVDRGLPIAAESAAQNPNAGCRNPKEARNSKFLVVLGRMRRSSSHFD